MDTRCIFTKKLTRNIKAASGAPEAHGRMAGKWMPMAPTRADQDRIIFLDNLRYLMVLLVVVLHAAASYSNVVPWWCVKDTAEHAIVFDLVLILLDVFLMPILFFIAGYFAVISLQKHGRGSFLKRKMRRLGLPLLFGIPLTSPAFYFIHHYTRGGAASHEPLHAVWLNYLKSAGSLKVGIIQSIEQFNQTHLWFMSLLLFFFILFSITCGRQKWITSDAVTQFSASVSGKGTILPFTVAGLLSALSMYTAAIIFASPTNPAPWVTIAGILQFEATNVLAYALYFIMGIFASHKYWFTRTTIPGRPAMWAVGCGLWTVSLLLVFRQMSIDFSPGLLFLFYFTRAFLCISCLAACTSWAQRSWNRPTKTSRLMALNSYHIYIVHFIIVIVIQWALARWTDGPTLLKFCIVSSVSIAMSYGISNYALRPHPRLSVIGIYLVCVFVVLGVGSRAP